MRANIWKLTTLKPKGWDLPRFVRFVLRGLPEKLLVDQLLLMGIPFRNRALFAQAPRGLHLTSHKKPDGPNGLSQAWGYLEVC